MRKCILKKYGYVNRKNVRNLCIQQRDDIAGKSLCNTVGRQFLREFRAFVATGKNVASRKKHKYYFAIRVSQRSLFSSYIALEVHTMRIPLSNTAGTRISRRRDNKSAGSRDDENVNFVVPRSFGDSSRFWDSLPIGSDVLHSILSSVRDKLSGKK